MNAQLADILRMKRPLSIRSAGFSPALKILAFGPHPDDFDAIGITMRFFKNNGNRIHVGVIPTSGGVEDSYVSPPTPEKKAALRVEEQRKSCRFFGLPDECLTFLDLEQDDKAEPTDTPINRSRLRDFILSCRPDLVFLPHGNDTNRGHRVVYAMFRQIASDTDYPIMAFLNKDPKTIDMRTDCYTEFSEEEAKWKRQLLRCHDSQHQRNLKTRSHGFDERILRVDQQTAWDLGIDQAYAEAFEMEWYGKEAEML